MPGAFKTGRQLKLMLREPASVGNLPTTLTEFGKVYGKKSHQVSEFRGKVLAHNGAKLNKPTLTFPVYVQPDFSHSKMEEKVEWVMSLDDINHYTPTVLICEVHDRREHIQYIGMPPKEGIRKGPVSKSQRVRNEIFPEIIETMSDSEGIEPIFRYLRGLSSEKHGESFGCDADYLKASETATPLAIYSWELGVHLPSLLMERLLATHRLELALKVAKSMYDYSRTENERWTFPLFQKKEMLESADATVPPSANIHASARKNPVAYVKRIALKYIEILVGLGDQHFRHDTLESIPLALERYIEASEAFSTLSGVLEVQTSPRAHNTKPILTYSKVEEERKKASSWLLEDGGFHKAKDTLRASLHQLIEDRLYKIKNGLDINGRKQRLALFAPPLDPGALAQARPAAGGIAGLLSGIESPMPTHRFDYLIRHALDIVSHFRGLEQQRLNIREKKDAESLVALRSRHQCTVLALINKVREHEKQKALKALDAISVSRTQHEKAMDYYLQLTADKGGVKVPKVGESWKEVPPEIHTIKGDNPMSPFEKEELDKSEKASDLYLAAGVVSALGEVLAAIPEFGAKVQPMGAGVDSSTGGSLFSRICNIRTVGLSIAAQRMQEEAMQAARKGALSRAFQERRQAINQIGWELMRLDKENRSYKLDAIYGPPFKGLTDYWEQSPDGQLAGESLYLDLKRMEMLHMGNRSHDFEIVKHISIRQLNPCALLQLREQGKTDFELPEVIFDMDFPGHYCRRIASVGISIPCILNAYTSLNCTLSLLEHKYRVSPTGSPNGFYEEKNEQNVFHRDSIPISAIAVSNGLHDTGVFTLEFDRQSRYGPFEGAGAISNWRLEFPSQFRHFDYNTITDVVIHLHYTAVDGGEQFAGTAASAAKQWVSEAKGSAFAVDLKTEYPDQWRQLGREGRMALPELKIVYSRTPGASEAEGDL
ncbi:uncharacterized protein BO87DRAFT_418304 [Aspergillus neoniger CBS 115656]|uniref:Tc toxin complex TcA C-terminal TcB-binding domain-containing protein n=1 Tax=Aspergillus neoniger (strain CBS 115656) TaxID=1448310 RepID=A0A318YCE1_ASPNB|nr:hypothetical protein BO87DRAFT_418304 [Aspergillus neoniger CBS 115656]PYH31237.1 hypothetical protein BO87DRAFT_418304 [Aspergillus neoniger CBS 115656]